MFSNLNKIIELADVKGPFQVYSGEGFFLFDQRQHTFFLNVGSYWPQVQKEIISFFGTQIEGFFYCPPQSNLQKVVLNQLPDELNPDYSDLVITPQNTIHAGGIQGLINIVDRLMGPGGCPWDQAQTHESLKKCLLEETFEVIDTIDQKNESKLIEELGDLLLQPVLHAQLEKRDGNWSINEVAQKINEKMIRRHPHVFGDVKLDTPEQVLKNWDQIKKSESDSINSVLGEIPRSMPATLRALKISERAARTGFDWPDENGFFDKLNEEVIELKQAIQSGDRQEIKSELGDAFLNLIGVARKLNVDPEEAINSTMDKFIKRFQYIEAQSGESFDNIDLEKWIIHWGQAKQVVG